MAGSREYKLVGPEGEVTLLPHEMRRLLTAVMSQLNQVRRDRGNNAVEIALQAHIEHYRSLHKETSVF